MPVYDFRPLDGLFAIENEISSAKIGNVFSYAENKIKSMPEGRTASLALLFYFIGCLNKSNLPFYVKGGLPLQYYLGENARPTYDLDIITNLDRDIFFRELENYLNNMKGNLIFKIRKYAKMDADLNYYYDTFNIEIEPYLDGKLLKPFLLDGMSCSLYDNINYHLYKAPKYLVKEFKGVEIEYVMAEKIIAVTGPLHRPVKHMIDVYSLINTSIDIDKLKKYLDIILDYEKDRREIKNNRYEITENQKFLGNYVMDAISAGYNITFEEMKNKVNKWMKENL